VHPAGMPVPHQIRSRRISLVGVKPSFSYKRWPSSLACRPTFEKPFSRDQAIIRLHQHVGDPPLPVAGAPQGGSM
jgi:hypothetical protein